MNHGMRLLLVLGLVISMLGTAGAAAAQEGSPVAEPAGGYPQEVLDAVSNTLIDVEFDYMPGVVIFIDSPAGRIHEAAGVANVQTGAAIDKDAPFQIGSNTKMMTAAVILQLQEEGLLKVDDPLSMYLPDIAMTLPAGDTITLRMLLQHTSGIYDYVEDVAANIFVTHHLTGSDSALMQAWTPAEIIDYTTTYRARNAYFAPGADGAWHYSNTNYILLGLVIEKVTGKSYEASLQERVFDPLGITSTELVNDVWTSDVAGYYQAPFDFDTSRWNLSGAWSAGAVVSTPEDMAVFVRALFGGKLFTNPETLTEMQTTVNGDLEYGLGLVRFDGIGWGHGGQTLGFLSKVVYNPETDTVLIAWTNTAVTQSISWIFLEDVLRSA